MTKLPWAKVGGKRGKRRARTQGEKGEARCLHGAGGNNSRYASNEKLVVR